MRIATVVGAIAISVALLGSSQSWAQERSTTIAVGSPVYVANTTPYAEIWSGVGGTRTFFGGYIGGNVALNATHNVWTDGFLVRGEAQVGQYRHTSDNTDDVLLHGGTLMLGYRMRVGSTGLLTGYVGANYETHDNDDRAANIRGTEVGFRAIAEYYTRLTPVIDFYGQASYSGAFDSVFAFSRVGFNVTGNAWTGPEFSFYRNESPYRETRLGWFVRLEEFFGGMGLTLAGGVINDLTTRQKDQPITPWYAGASIYFTLQ